MKTILKLLFKEMMRKSGDVKHIHTASDLSKVIWSQEKLIALLAILNDEADFCSEEILYIAEQAYQEVRDND